MSYLRGIVVQLNTGLGKHSGTDDPIYVGVAGTAGGRVFRSGTAIWLGVEYGMQVWIPEVDPDDLTPSLRA